MGGIDYGSYAPTSTIVEPDKYYWIVHSEHAEEYLGDNGHTLPRVTGKDLPDMMAQLIKLNPRKWNGVEPILESADFVLDSGGQQ